MIVEAVEGIMKGVVKPILDKFIPDAKDRLEAELLITKQLHEVDLEQIEVNKAEATNANVFVSGWRPFIGWVCGASFAYAVIGNDLLNWMLAFQQGFTGHVTPALPEPDLTMTFELLLGMLGLGGYRTYEKIKGVAK